MTSVVQDSHAHLVIARVKPWTVVPSSIFGMQFEEQLHVPWSPRGTGRSAIEGANLPVAVTKVRWVAP